MTSAGSAERVAKAKKTLIAAIIGLIIIIASFAIVTIIVNFISNTILNGNNNGCQAPTPFPCPGGCQATPCGTIPPNGSGTFRLKSTAPSNNTANHPRNTQVKGFLSAPVRADVDADLFRNFIVERIGTVDAAGNLTNPTVTAVAGSSTVFTNRTTINFAADAACGDERGTQHCFEAWSRYRVTIDGYITPIHDISDRSLDCFGGSPCQFTFDTNDSIDTAPPTAGIVPSQICNFNPNPTPPDANWISGWGHDDFSVVHLQLFTPPANLIAEFYGSNPSLSGDGQVNANSIAVGATITSTVEVEDGVNNITNATTTETVRVGHCCNGILDTGDGEEEIDCGGPDCDSCASLNPVITNISPTDGARGNMVTITGHYFGTTEGWVYFYDNNIGSTTVLAPFPNTINAACTNNWQSNQIIVVVPNAQTGPIRVRRADGREDTTSDNYGPQMDFTMNTIVRPGLCSTTPSSAYFSDPFVLHGNNFSIATPRSVRFGNTTDYITANSINWLSGMQVSANVPNVTRGRTTVYVTAAAENSNPLYFTVLTNTANKPIIDRIDPDRGPNKQYITIYGSHFLSYRGGISIVKFINLASSASTTAGIDFPVQCRDSWWRDSYIIVKVTENIAIGNYRILVTNSAAEVSDPTDSSLFNVTAGNPSPGICTLLPHNGPVGTLVNVYGDNYDNTRDVNNDIVRFYNNAPATIYNSWHNQEIDTAVPTGAATGPVVVFANGTTSNSLPFTVGSCTKAQEAEECDTLNGEVCCISGQWAGICRQSADCAGSGYAPTGFGWTFTTSPTAGPGQPCFLGATPATCHDQPSQCDTTQNLICDIDNTCTCIPGTDSTDSCIGIAQQTNSCGPRNCPNSPGSCSPYTSQGEIPLQPNQTCDSDCSSIGGAYETNLDACVINQVCSTFFQDVFGKDLLATCVASRWQVTTPASCPNGWLRADNNHCVDTASACSLCPTNFTCRDYNNDRSGECLYKNKLCPGTSHCVGDQCVANDKDSCECCCDKTQNNAADGTNPACCAPLTCDDECGQGGDFGYCTGCAAAPDPDAACNCAGASGKFCDTTTNTKGICRDCAALNSTACVGHPDACCVDAQKNNNCRGIGDGDVNGDGTCAYFNCEVDAATGNASCVNSGSAGQYRSQTECDPNCTGANDSTGGAPCVNTYVGLCDTGLADCGNVYSCLDGQTSDNICRCCCDPTNPANDTCPDTLTCLANKAPCGGANRGLCCGCKTNDQCFGGAFDGCGGDACCHPRPRVLDVYPADQSSGICRNTAIQATFNEPMDTNRLTNNIILLGDYGTATCPAGTKYLALGDYQPKPTNTFGKIKNIFVKLLAKVWPSNKALAQVPIPGNTYCAVPGTVTSYLDATDQTVADFKLNIALDANATYFVVILGDENLDNLKGVLSQYKIGMNGPSNTNNVFNGITYNHSYIWAFRTGGDICQLASVTIDPASFLFSVPNSTHPFHAVTHSTNDQEIISILGVYAWSWNWRSENTSVVTVTNDLAPPPAPDVQTVTSQNVRDGKTIVSATANITDNTLSNVPSQAMTGRADVYVFLCENPWPPRDNLGNWAPWRDPTGLDQNNQPYCLTGLAGCNPYNYELYYCRDSGGKGTYDDLPVILNNAIIRGASANGSTLKETYFFREEVPTASSSNFNVTNDGTGNSLTASWAPPLPPEPTFNRYRLYWGLSSKKYSDHFDLNTTTHTVTGLKNNTNYYFLLSGIYTNEVEKTLYSEVVASTSDTGAPDQPTPLTVATTTEGITLKWNAVTDASSYKVYYGTVSGTYGSSQNVGAETSVIITGLSLDRSYYFAVTAIDASGNESPRLLINEAHIP
jgi:hypothetical protein